MHSRTSYYRASWEKVPSVERLGGSEDPIGDVIDLPAAPDLGQGIYGAICKDIPTGRDGKGVNLLFLGLQG